MTKRKSRRPRTTLRERIALASADGMAPSVIAAVVGLPLERLRRDFAVELEHGPEIIRLAHLVSLSTAAKGGSSPAAKALLALSDRPEPEKPAEERPESDLVGRALRILDGGKR
jgi:hypothetical protein